MTFDPVAATPKLVMWRIAEEVGHSTETLHVVDLAFRVRDYFDGKIESKLVRDALEVLINVGCVNMLTNGKVLSDDDTALQTAYLMADEVSSENSGDVLAVVLVKLDELEDESHEDCRDFPLVEVQTVYEANTVIDLLRGEIDDTLEDEDRKILDRLQSEFMDARSDLIVAEEEAQSIDASP